MAAPKIDQIADAIRDCFISPNETDSNWENANIVDVLGKISRGLFAVARAINMQTLASVAHTAELEKKLKDAIQ